MRCWTAIAFVGAASASYIATPRCIGVHAGVLMSDADAVLTPANFRKESDGPASPRWVNFVNSALEESAVASVVAFVLVDIGSAACILAAITALNVSRHQEKLTR